MKAKRRHELQHNVLDAELGKGVEWIKTHGARILWGILAVGAITLAVWTVFHGRGTNREQIRTSYYSIIGRLGSIVNDDTLETLKGLSEQTTIEPIAADSCVEVANVYFQRMQLAEDAQQRSEFEQSAREYYNKAIEDFPDQPLAGAKGHYGLAKIAENQAALSTDADSRKLAIEAAKAEYEQILRTKGIDGENVLDLAGMSLNRLAGVAEPVKMATTAPADDDAEENAVEAATDPESPATQPGE